MRKRTIRRLPPVAREVGKAHNDAEALGRVLKRLVERVAQLEVENRLLRGEVQAWEWRAKAEEDQQAGVDPAVALGAKEGA